VDLNTFNKTSDGYLGVEGATTKIFTSFKDHINKVMYDEQTGIKPSIDAVTKATDDLYNEGKSDLGNLATAIDEWYSVYGDKMDKAFLDTIGLDNALTTLMREYSMKLNVEGSDAINKLAEALERLKDAMDALNIKSPEEVNMEMPEVNPSGNTEVKIDVG
jgi:hypothetical protein